MPYVDFTLDDIAKQTKQIVTQAISQALLNERAYNRAMMYEISREVATEVVTTELMNFWDHNLGPVLEEMMADIQTLKHAIAQPH